MSDKQLWKYTRILESRDGELRFEMLEDNEIRCFIRPVNCGYENWAIPPVYNVNRDEVELADDQQTDKEQTT